MGCLRGGLSCLQTSPTRIEMDQNQVCRPIYGLEQRFISRMIRSWAGRAVVVIVKRLIGSIY